MISRRRFLASTGVAVAAPLAAGAQPSGKLPRIGVVGSGRASRLVAFREGMRALGYVEGRNCVIEVRAVEGAYDRLPRVLTELIALNVDVIVTSGVPSALAAKRATTVIPIVAASVGDPVGIGLVSNLARPGGNVTAISHFAADLSGKQVDLFKQAVPGLSRIGVLYNPTNPLHPEYWRDTEMAAKALSVTLVRLVVHDLDELTRAFDVARRERANGLLVLSDPFFNDQWMRIAKTATTARLPLMSPYREYVEAGGLLSYGPNLDEILKRAVVYVDKILKGAKPGDLPVEQPTKFELLINTKTAETLGLTIPPSLLGRADRLIR